MQYNIAIGALEIRKLYRQTLIKKQSETVAQVHEKYYAARERGGGAVAWLKNLEERSQEQTRFPSYEGAKVDDLFVWQLSVPLHCIRYIPENIQYIKL
jgi:hypothetical protein